MSLFDGLRHRVHSLLHARQHERELSDELAFHVEREAAQQSHNAPSLLSGQQAIEAARRRIGNVTRAQEQTRSAAGLSLFDVIGQDVRFAIRSFRSTPAFAIIVVLTLALGIGATTAMVSAANALLLRPLPFSRPDQLVAVSLVAPATPTRPPMTAGVWSYPKFAAFRDLQHVFSDITLWTEGSFTLRTRADSRRLEGEYTDARYFITLGLPLLLGRNFLADEARDVGGPQVAIISAQLWHNAFGSDTAVVGRTVQVDGRNYTIVGVGPSSFHGVSGVADLWMPITSAPLNWQASDPYNHVAFVIARLPNGVTTQNAQGTVALLGSQVDVAYPDRQHANRHWSAIARSIDDARTHPQTQRTLYLLLAAVVLVLLTACANVANLMLVRASSRQREIAVRLALGATRARLVRQLLAESLVLATVGGAASIVVAFAAVHALASVQSAVIGDINNATGMGTVRFSVVRFDWVAFGVTGALALATGLMCGVVPAIQATRASVIGAIKGAGNTLSFGQQRFNSRNVLTVAEIACAVVLLTGSGLMIRSVQHLLQVRTGFDATRVLALRVNRAPEWSRDSIDTFYDEAIRRTASLPGVSSVAMMDCPPLARCQGSFLIRTDRPNVPNENRPRVGMHWITPDVTKVLHIPLVSGRLFTRGDDDHSRKVVLINQTAARTIWPGEDPVGRAVALPRDDFRSDTAYVVGVVGDVLYDAINSAPRPEVYLSYFQTHFTYRMMLLVRTSGEIASIIKGVSSTLHAFAPGFPVYDIGPLPERVADATAYARIVTTMLTLFAAVTLVLAMIGTYGVVAFTVSQRTRDISVRVALGANNAQISQLVVRQAVLLAATGLGVGLAFALVATRPLRSLLYGVTASDPPTLVAIVVLLVASVGVATFIPARRAMRVKPALVLRAQ